MGTAGNVAHHEPWNKGKIVGQKAPFKLKDIRALRVRLQMNRRVRELALFNLGIDSKLRGCDLGGRLRCQLCGAMPNWRSRPGAAFHSGRPKDCSRLESDIRARGPNVSCRQQRSLDGCHTKGPLHSHSERAR